MIDRFRSRYRLCPQIVGHCRSKSTMLVTCKDDRDPIVPKPPFLITFMLKLPTIAIVSTVSLLSVVNSCEARSIERASIHQVFSQSRPYSLAKQSKVTSRNISDSDLKSIQRVISDRYATKNQVLESVSSTSRRFYEVKSLKLISFSDTKAQIEVEENVRGYELLGSRYVSHHKSDLFEQPTSEYTKNTFNINLEKSAGKWKINTHSK
jgi:hypothetical protein